MIEVIVNGKRQELAREVNVAELLKLLDIEGERIAIEINEDVIRKRDWHNVKITTKDKIEIIHFVGGG